MTFHGNAFAGPRGAAGLLSAVLVATATATALPLRSSAATACGGTAEDLVGKFVSHRSGAAGTPGQGYQGTATVTFSAPNTVQDACTNGTQVSSFTGTYTDPQGTAASQPETYTRQP